MPRRSAKSRRALSLLTTLIELIRVWLVTRENSIKAIRRIADDLDRVRKNVNVAKITGASTGITGVALLGVGAVASILTMGAAAPFLIGAGVAATAGGGLISGGAEVTRFVNDEIDQSKVKKILREDQAELKEVDKTMRTLQDVIKQISQEEKLTEEEAWNDICVTFLNRDRTEHDADAGEFRFHRSPIPSFIPVVGALGITKALSEWSLLAVRNVARGGIAVLAPISIAIDTYQIVTTVEDMSHGSRSDLGRQLRKIANDLEAEFNKHRDFLDNLS